MVATHFLGLAGAGGRASWTRTIGWATMLRYQRGCTDRPVAEAKRHSGCRRRGALRGSCGPCRIGRRPSSRSPRDSRLTCWRDFRRWLRTRRPDSGFVHWGWARITVQSVDAGIVGHSSSLRMIVGDDRVRCVMAFTLAAAGRRYPWLYNDRHRTGCVERWLYGGRGLGRQDCSSSRNRQSAPVASRRSETPGPGYWRANPATDAVHARCCSCPEATRTRTSRSRR
jgi:hypothetical protein